ncbi:helix-turn-helix domain-containing protein [Myroides sp. C15-4]|uniref:helix-turn-helix domain-containing protein n=1 Tax=Myroides sp. C15-4 TaxID=3400532 RepID=UPI003D2F8277
MEQLKEIPNYTARDILQLLQLEDIDRGIYVSFRKYFSPNPFKDPYKYDRYTLLLVKQGYIEVQINLVDYTIDSHSIVIIAPDMVLFFKTFSEDIDFVVISFDKAFALTHSEMKRDKDIYGLLAANQVKKINLIGDQEATLVGLCELIRLKNYGEQPPTEQVMEVVAALFSIFLSELVVCYQSNEKTSIQNPPRKESLTLQFLALLQEHFRTEKQIQFYADALCISENYLAKIVKEVSGKTMGQHINNAIVIEAQLLLLKTTLSISEIAETLHFSTPSFFGSFFKRNVGCSPKVYQKNRR